MITNSAEGRKSVSLRTDMSMRCFAKNETFFKIFNNTNKRHRFASNKTSATCILHFRYIRYSVQLSTSMLFPRIYGKGFGENLCQIIKTNLEPFAQSVVSKSSTNKNPNPACSVDYLFLYLCQLCHDNVHLSVLPGCVFYLFML